MALGRSARHKFRFLGWVICLMLSAAGSLQAQDRMVREYPPSEYYLALAVFNEGEFVDAAKGFRQAARSGVRSTEGRWVDSICYHTMLGECLYQMGDLGAASDELTAAINLFLAHRNWLLRVELPVALEPATTGPRRPINWGASTRRTVPARFPDVYPIIQGGADLETIVRQGGGVVSLPEIHMINAQEIMRCMALAIRRRGEILGQTAVHDPLTNQLLQVLATRPAPPNHWSQAWVGTLLGLTYASAGRPQEAASELSKSTVAAAQFDHHLTGPALFALGKLAFEQEQHANAQGFFLEASLIAAYFGDMKLVEESLRWGTVTHLVSGQPGMYAPLGPAVSWSRRESAFLQASLLISSAEVSAAVSEPAAALTFLDQARRAMVRSDMLAGAVGARYQYVAALANYQTENLKAADAAFAALLIYQRKGSLRLFELGLVDRLATSGAVTDRVASQLYAHALREPQTKDWSVDPVETLSLVLTPHLGPLEHWLEVSLQRKEFEKALEISDQIRRHRFFTSLPMGGRLVALRWVLEAPESSLSDHARLQRQELLARFPRYKALSQQATTLRHEIASLPLVPEDSDTKRKQMELMAQLNKVSISQELQLREIALRRVAAEFVFPPRLQVKDFQKSLPPNTLVLSFLTTSKSLHVFTLGSDSCSHATMAVGNAPRKQVAALLRELGQIDKNQPVDIATLQKETWKEPARELWTLLTEGVNFPSWDQVNELVVVPDGVLWYLPFEALQVQEGDTANSLIAQTKMRYAPTIALALPDNRPVRPLASTSVVVGQLFPREGEEASQATLDRLREVLPAVSSLGSSLAIPSGLLAPFCERLVVLTDIMSDSSNPYDWSPMQFDRGKSGSLLSSWLRLPWGSPQQIALPGFHTSAENALKRGGNGDEVFLAVCGLMAAGSRTVLISRWRNGGQTAQDLVREFAQELPFTTAAEAWQRSVFLNSQNELMIEREPRVKPTNLEVSVKADHPFFWSGYALFDTGLTPRLETKDRPDAAVAEAADSRE